MVIAAERRGDTVAAMLKQIVAATSDQRAVLSAVGLPELAHGIYRAQTAEARNRRDAFLLNVGEQPLQHLKVTGLRLWRCCFSLEQQPTCDFLTSRVAHQCHTHF